MNTNLKISLLFFLLIFTFCSERDENNTNFKVNEVKSTSISKLIDPTIKLQSNLSFQPDLILKVKCGVNHKIPNFAKIYGKYNFNNRLIRINVNNTCGGYMQFYIYGDANYKNLLNFYSVGKGETMDIDPYLIKASSLIVAF
ncbi:MAG: hypothetical protein ACEQSF_06470 [Solirubrobacteraceae bacterium]